MPYGRRMRLSVAVGALQERPFRLLFAGRLVSAVGDALVPVALAFAVLDATGSATDLGLVFAAREVASVAVLLAAGVWADRVRRERMMIGSNLVSFAAQGATGLLLVSGSAHLWELLVFQAVAGGADGAFNPARNAITPQVVSPTRLQEANALLGVTGSATSVIGPLVAATLVTAGSPGIALLVDAASFLVSAAILTRLRTTRPKRGDTRFFEELGQGWAEFMSHAWLWKSVALVCIANLMAAPYFVLGPVIAKTYLGGATAWGIIMAGNAVGWVVGAFLSARIKPARPMLATHLAALVWAVQVPMLALHPNTLAVAATAMIGGCGIAMSLTYWFTTLQSKIPAESLSRVSSYDDLASFIFNPLGFALVGPIAAAIGTSVTIIASAVISATAYILAASLPSVRALRLDQDADTPPSTSTPPP
jgi:MFS family permease